MLKKLMNRLKEPSSLAGLSMLAVMFGVAPEVADTVTGAVGALLAVGAILVPEAAK